MKLGSILKLGLASVISLLISFSIWNSSPLIGLICGVVGVACAVIAFVGVWSGVSDYEF